MTETGILETIPANISALREWIDSLDPDTLHQIAELIRKQPLTPTSTAAPAPAAEVLTTPAPSEPASAPAPEAPPKNPSLYEPSLRLAPKERREQVFEDPRGVDLKTLEDTESGDIVMSGPPDFQIFGVIPGDPVILEDVTTGERKKWENTAVGYRLIHRSHLLSTVNYPKAVQLTALPDASKPPEWAQETAQEIREMPRPPSVQRSTPPRVGTLPHLVRRAYVQASQPPPKRTVIVRER